MWTGFRTGVQFSPSPPKRALSSDKALITKEEGKLVSNTTIDYNVMDLAKFVKDQPSLKEYLTSDNHMSLKGVKSIYESLGAVCEE